MGALRWCLVTSLMGAWFGLVCFAEPHSVGGGVLALLAAATWAIGVSEIYRAVRRVY